MRALCAVFTESKRRSSRCSRRGRKNKLPELRDLVSARDSDLRVLIFIGVIRIQVAESDGNQRSRGPAHGSTGDSWFEKQLQEFDR